MLPRLIPLCVLAACVVPETGSSSRPATPALQEYRRVQSMAMGFADTYEAFLAEAADDVARRAGTVEARKTALGLKLWGVTAAYTIVADENPDAALIDLVVLVTLQQMTWQEQERPFGEHVVVLRRVLDRLAQEVWSLAGGVLDEQEREELREIIGTWRDEHPGHTYVEFVRFRDISVAADAPKLLGRYRRGLLFASMADAAREAERLRLFSERALFVAERLPILLAWQAQQLYLDLLTSPEVTAIRDDIGSVANAATQLGDTAEGLPEQFEAAQVKLVDRLAERIAAEREAMVQRIGAELDRQREKTLEAFDARSDESRKLSSEMRETLLAGQRFAEAAEKMLLVAERLVADDTEEAGGAGAPAVAGEPRDIADYTAAAEKFTEAANEMRRALESANNLLESEAWQRRVDEIDRAAAGRIADAGGRGEGIVDRIFWGALVLVLVFLAGLWFVRARTRRA